MKGKYKPTNRSWHLKSIRQFKDGNGNLNGPNMKLEKACIKRFVAY